MNYIVLMVEISACMFMKWGQYLPWMRKRDEDHKGCASYALTYGSRRNDFYTENQEKMFGKFIKYKFTLVFSLESHSPQVHENQKLCSQPVTLRQKTTWWYTLTESMVPGEIICEKQSFRS